MQLPKETKCRCQCSVKMFVHVPAGEGCAWQPPYPLVTFHTGFQATSSNYQAYAQRLASWGFAVMSYDFVKLSPALDAVCHTDAAEAGFMLAFLAGLWRAADPPGSPLHGQIDDSSIAAVGHSRGGKIAALHLAGMTPNVKTAYLIDPVDGSTFTQHLPGYPSAIELLKGRGKRFGMSAAGRIGLCNGAPFATANWTGFDQVAAEGSWLEVVTNAGHLQFVSIASAWDALCCTGCKGLVSQQEGMQLAMVPMVAWLQKELRGWSGDINPLSALGAPASFMDWVCAAEAAGKLQFVVKGIGEICPQGRRAIMANPLLRVEVMQLQAETVAAAARLAAVAAGKAQAQ